MKTENRYKVGFVLATLFGLALSAHATVLLDQTAWTTGNRRTQNLPTTSAWFTSSSGSLTVSGGALRLIVISGSDMGMTYFTPNSNSPPIQLNVGDTLAVTLKMSFSGVPTPGSSSQGFKLGIFDFADGGNVPKRVSADGSFSSSSQGINVSGYSIFGKMYQVFGDTSPIDIRSRTTLSDTSLLGASGDWTSLAKPNLSTNGFGGFTNSTPYSLQFILQRTSLTAMAITETWSNFANGATLSVSTVDNAATSFSFDGIAYRPQANTSAPLTNLFQEVKVEVTSSPLAPSIVTDLTNQTVSSGQTVNFTIVPNGTLPLSYQWYFNTNSILTNTSVPTLTLTNVQVEDAGGYSLIVSNSYGTSTGAVANLTVNLASPTITTQPLDQTVFPTGTATFSVAALGSEPFTYQWYFNNTTLLSNATGSTLALTNVQPGDAGLYSVLVSNPVDTVMSSNAVLTVNTNPVAPFFTTQPVPVAATVGDDVTFSAVAVGTLPISYQWNTNGIPLPGATSSTLSLHSVQLGNAGNYSVTASNSVGTTNSTVVALTVTPKLPPPLPNIPTNQFVITDFGAVGNSISNSASAIQNTIAAATAAGGGVVVVPVSGNLSNYLSGPITLANNIDLQVNAGVTLKMLPRASWPSLLPPFISGSSLHDVAITGTGTIDGNAGFGSTNWWPALDTAHRPDFIHFDGGTQRILIQGVTLQKPPAFHLMLKGNNVSITIQNITINTDPNSPNTDGMDLASTNILVQNCFISDGDDNIEIGGSGGPAADITVSNCTFGAGHGVSIGSNIQGGVHDLTVSNCTFTGTDYGIRMKSDRDLGGVVQNLVYRDITMTNVGIPIAIYSFYDTVGTPDNITPSGAAANAAQPIVTLTPVWQNILFSNITSVAATDGNINGIIWSRQEIPASNITLIGVNLISPARTFCVYNARGIQIVNSLLTAPTGTNTLTLYNAEVTITNNAPGAGPVTIGGLTRPLTNNVLTVFNTLATVTDTNALGPNPLLNLSSSTLTVNNGLNLGGPSMLNFGIGTNATDIAVAGNLVLGGTFNIADGGGFADSIYTLFTYGGTLTWNSPNLGTLPTGHNYTIDTNTLGLVKLIVMPPLTAFQQWQVQYFGSTTNANAAVNADPDGDGQNNLAEFLSGTNPTNSSSGLRIISALRQAGNVVITWTTTGGFTNAVQATAGGGNGGYATNFTDISGPIIVQGSGDVTTNYVDGGGATNNPSRYYRIRLVP